jgi:cytidylate kinase
MMDPMAVVTVGGEAGCRVDQAARAVAQRLGFELISDAAARRMIGEEFSAGSAALPDHAWRHMLASIVARLAARHHIVVCVSGAETLVRRFPGSMRVLIVAPESFRIGTLMLDERLERPAALAMLRRLDRERKTERRARFGRATPHPDDFDLVVNAESMASEHIGEVIAAAAAGRGLAEEGLLSPAAEAQLQFQHRLQLARHGITAAGRVEIRRAAFGHPSEEIFAKLLDFYRIAWEYEPRSFAVRWDGEGRVVESFTPDFYLPEQNLYIELTTMKQAHVTRKNRKVKLLRALYPEINIQVFYQKDVQELILKYGLAEHAHPA